MSSSTYVIAFRDDSIQEIEARSVSVQDGSIQLLNEAGDVIAAFPKESIRGVFPRKDEPPMQASTYTAWDHAIQSGIRPLLDERNLKVEGKYILLGAVAREVLVESDEYEGLQGFRIGVTDEEFDEAVRRWTHDPAEHEVACDFSPEGRHKWNYTVKAKATA